MKKLLLFLALAIITGSCKLLLFDQPMPIVAESVETLPPWLRGIFYIENEDNDPVSEVLLEFRSVEPDGMDVMVYGYYGFRADSLDWLIQHSIKDSVEIRVEDSLVWLIIPDEDESVAFYREKGWYISEQETKYELDLSQHYFIDDFEEKEFNDAELRTDGKDLYLNIKEGEFWNIIQIQKLDDGIRFARSMVSDDSTFMEQVALLGIDQKVEELEEDFLIHANDDDLVNIFNAENMFKSEMWIRKPVQEFDLGTNWVLLITLVFLIALVISLRRLHMKHRA